MTKINNRLLGYGLNHYMDVTVKETGIIRLAVSVLSKTLVIVTGNLEWVSHSLTGAMRHV